MIGHDTVTIFRECDPRSWVIDTVSGCMWHGSTGETTSALGQVESNSVTVLLPVLPLTRDIRANDILMLGDRAADFSPDASREELLDADESITVVQVQRWIYGSADVRHVRVVGV